MFWCEEVLGFFVYLVLVGCLICYGVEWVSEIVNEWVRNVSIILYRVNYGIVLDVDWGLILGVYLEEYLIRNYMGLGGISFEMEG